MRKIALLTGVAGALFAAPVLAQDASAGMAPAPVQTQTAEPAQDGGVTLQPGADVHGQDGVRLGALEGVQVNDAGQQELTVRGDDGLLRAVSVAGFRVDDGDVFLSASLEDYLAGDVLNDPNQGQGDAAAPTPPPSVEPLPTEPLPTEPLPTEPEPIEPEAS